MDNVTELSIDIPRKQKNGRGYGTQIEEQILFDSDKIDVTGTIGIARTDVHSEASELFAAAPKQL